MIWPTKVSTSSTTTTKRRKKKEEEHKKSTRRAARVVVFGIFSFKALLVRVRLEEKRSCINIYCNTGIPNENAHEKSVHRSNCTKNISSTFE
jgi:hypothetical protein